MNEKISVVIAVYNTAAYLNRCVDSILAQTYHNIELLIVDDGSTSDSGNMCDAYAEIDSRVKVFHVENAGLSVARNFAVKRAIGHYISFVDSDDVLHPELYMKSIEALLKDNTRIVKYAYCIEETGMNNIAEVHSIVVSAIEATQKILADEWGSQLWQFLFEKELWEHIISPPGRLAQDMMVLYLVTSKVQKVSVLSNVLYYYYHDRATNVSNLNKKGIRGTVDRAYAYWLRIDFCINNSDYYSMFGKCLKKAAEYTVSCFCNNELFVEKRYNDDRNLFRKNVKRYRKEIFRKLELSSERKLCLALVIYVPRWVPFFKAVRNRMKWIGCKIVKSRHLSL